MKLFFSILGTIVVLISFILIFFITYENIFIAHIACCLALIGVIVMSLGGDYGD